MVNCNRDNDAVVVLFMCLTEARFGFDDVKYHRHVIGFPFSGLGFQKLNEIVNIDYAGLME